MVPLGDSVVSALQNRIDHRKGEVLKGIVAIEDTVRRAPGAQAILEQIRPGFVWLEVKPLAGKLMGGLRWYADGGFPSPAYRLEVGAWPFDGNVAARPEVQLWMTRDRTPAESGSLEYAPGETLDGSLGKGREIIVAGQTVVMDSVTPEDRFVTVAPGE